MILSITSFKCRHCKDEWVVKSDGSEITGMEIAIVQACAANHSLVCGLVRDLAKSMKVEL